MFVNDSALSLFFFLPFFFLLWEGHTLGASEPKEKPVDANRPNTKSEPSSSKTASKSGKFLKKAPPQLTEEEKNERRVLALSAAENRSLPKKSHKMPSKKHEFEKSKDSVHGAAENLVKQFDGEIPAQEKSMNSSKPNVDFDGFDPYEASIASGNNARAAIIREK